MQPYIHVSFERMARDLSVEASIHRWVARLESPTVSIQRAIVTLEQVGRRRLSVALTLELDEGAASIATTTHEDVYVAVADAFRAVRRALLDRAARTSRARPAIGFAA